MGISKVGEDGLNIELMQGWNEEEEVLIRTVVVHVNKKQIMNIIS